MLSANTTKTLVDDETVRSDLRHKFAWLLRIRRDAERGTMIPRAEAQALAQAFPGALRELDDAPIAALEERYAELERGDLPAWATATWLYHCTLRDLLDAARRGERPRGHLVDVAIGRVALALGLSAEDASAFALPYARRRTRHERGRSSRQVEDVPPPLESEPPPFGAPGDE